MLRDRYTPMDLFACVPALSLALYPVLAQLDRLLDDEALFQQVKAMLRRGLGQAVDRKQVIRRIPMSEQPEFNPQEGAERSLVFIGPMGT